jgi:hypothetical protein
LISAEILQNEIYPTKLSQNFLPNLRGDSKIQTPSKEVKISEKRPLNDTLVHLPITPSKNTDY